MTIPDGYDSNVTSISKINTLKAIKLAMTVDFVADLIANLKLNFTYELQRNKINFESLLIINEI